MPVCYYMKGEHLTFGLLPSYNKDVLNILEFPRQLERLIS